MIEDLLSYRLSDLLLFSPQSYLRQFELYNHWLWPTQGLGYAYGFLLPWLIRYRAHTMIRIWISLAALFTLICCYGFLWRFYLQINWMIEYLIIIWIAQAGLLLWIAWVFGQNGKLEQSAPVRWLGFTLWLISLIMQPLLELVNGRDWAQLSSFALTPDSLGYIVVALVLLFHLPLYLAFPAVLWLLFSTLSYAAMESPMAILPAFAIAVYLLAALARRPLRPIF